MLYILVHQQSVVQLLFTYETYETEQQASNLEIVSYPLKYQNKNFYEAKEKELPTWKTT